MVFGDRKVNIEIETKAEARTETKDKTETKIEAEIGIGVMKMKETEGTRIYKRLQREAGAGLMEYSVLVAGILAVAIPAMTLLGQETAGEAMCRMHAAYSNEHVSGELGNNLWDERWWNEDTRTCNLKANSRRGGGGCDGWPCPD